MPLSDGQGFAVQDKERVKAVTTESSTTSFDSPAYGESPTNGTTDVAKDQAAGVAGSAKDAGQHVAGVAKNEAGNVAAEAGRQVKDILGQTRGEISRQAAEQQQRVAGGLRSLGTELGSMAERSDESGVATDLARQASGRVHDLADWLDQRDPGSLLDEVKSFARQRPGAFLAIAVGAGLAAGRLTRGLKDDSASSSSTGTTAPATGYAPATTPATGYTPATAGYASPAGEYAVADEYDPLTTPAVIVEPVVPADGPNYGATGTTGSQEPRL
jgi:hypothetical protein